MHANTGDLLKQNFYVVAVVPEATDKGFFVCASGKIGTKPVLGSGYLEQFKETARKLLLLGPISVEEINQLMDAAAETGRQNGLQPCIGTDLETAKTQFDHMKKHGTAIGTGTLIILEFRRGTIIQTHKFDDSQMQIVQA